MTIHTLPICVDLFKPYVNMLKNLITVTIKFANAVGWRGVRDQGLGWEEGRGSGRVFITKEFEFGLFLFNAF